MLTHHHHLLPLFLLHTSFTNNDDNIEAPQSLSLQSDSNANANTNGSDAKNSNYSDDNNNNNNNNDNDNINGNVKNENEIIRVAAITTCFAGALLALNSYQCRECIEILHSLPKKHFRSGWVQNVLGKAYFEICEYKPALLALKEMLRVEPFRIKGIDILSTTLWHLRKGKELCSLAQQVVEVDKMSPGM